MSPWVIVMLVVYTLACMFLIFVILIQSGDKGGGLSSLGSSSQGLSDALGATGAEKTLNKATTICAVLFILLAILLSYTLKNSVQSSENLFPDAAAAPVAPLSSPATGAAPKAPANPLQVDVQSNGGVEFSQPIQIPTSSADEKAPPIPSSEKLPAASSPAAGAAPSSPAPAAPANPPASPPASSAPPTK